MSHDDFLTLAHMRAGLEEAIRERDEAIALATAMKTASVIAIRERDEALVREKNADANFDAINAELARADEDNDRLRALLRKAEWTGMNKHAYCVFCGQCEADGHAAHCEVKAALEGR